MKAEFGILNWNVGGSKYLVRAREERSNLRADINRDLLHLVKSHRPDVVALQEAVSSGDPGEGASHLIDAEAFGDYRYYYFPLIDSERFSFRGKWDRIKAEGGWPEETFFSQGNALMIARDLPHIPVWSLAESDVGLDRSRHYVEQVNLDLGLYFGDRDTEPRAALVAHFVISPGARGGRPEGTGQGASPLDVFVVNIHLTTLRREREGIPQVDVEASRIRRAQIETVLMGVVSRYNLWKEQGYPNYGKIPSEVKDRVCNRPRPVWVLAGDFNFTPESSEYRTIQRMNFVDAVPHKGAGTKARGVGNRATLTVDYIFAGPKFVALDPLILERELSDNNVDHTIRVSDHFPMFARIPLDVPEG